MVVLKPDTPTTRFAMNQLAREELKQKILKDILLDMNICKLEGWNGLEFVDDLIMMLQDVRQRR